MSATQLPNEARENKPLVLLLEDDSADVFLFRRALGKLHYECDVRAVTTASEARRYMLNEGEYKDRAYYRKPDLVVSDFKLAGHTALDFVQWLRGNPAFADVPVVMLSGETSQMDPALFIGLAVNSFLRKSPDVSVLGSMLQPLLP